MNESFPVLLVLLAPPLALAALLIFLRATVRAKKGSIASPKVKSNSPSLGFLHPHALSGGGGERVLWCAVLAAKHTYPNSQVVIYSAWRDADVQCQDAVAVSRDRVGQQFGLDLSDVNFLPINLSCASLVDPLHYPRFTLLFQALGAARLGLHAFWKQPVDVFVDTANLTFALVGAKALGAITMSYVHYPTISTDMLSVVRDRRAQFNNSAAIARSLWKSNLKLAYYRAFATLYALAALCVDVPLANSSWTRGHLVSLWWNKEIETVFPPCPTPGAQEEGKREGGLIVSVGQFRPEKNHTLQLDALEILLNSQPDSNARLIMIGGARNEADRKRAAQLTVSAEMRRLPVTIVVDATREELDGWLSRATVGVHTMRDEHFGISVVELQAAGIVAIGHQSGGVRMDIVKEGVSGYLAESAAEYAEKIGWVIAGGDEIESVRDAGMEAARRFSDKEFQSGFGKVLGGRVGRLLRRAQDDNVP